MDSYTFNKIAGAVLGTCLVGMGIKIVATGALAPEEPKKPGYALPNPKAETAKNDEQPGVTPIAVRLAKADPKKGEADAKVCTACHNLEEGAGAKIGPDLYGVVDRPKGKEPGFNYSSAMKSKGGDWTYADLDKFLTKPAAYVPGTMMGYPGQEDPEKRADIIAYLRTLSKHPAPLPKPTAAEEKEAKAGGGESGAKSESKGKAAGEAAGEADFLKLVGSSDPKKGQADAQVCSACHNFKKGGGTLIGPDLWNVVDRKKGSVPGYDYSEGLKKKGGEWTIDDLNAWLTNPAKYIPGTKMGYPGESSEKKRAQIIAFLRTLSDHPVALPNEKEGAEKAAAPHEGETKNMVPGAKPSDQKPPAPPNPPGSPQPVPTVPEKSTASGAPQKPDERRPDMPKPAPAQDQTKAKDLPGKADASSDAKPGSDAKSGSAEDAKSDAGSSEKATGDKPAAAPASSPATTAPAAEPPAPPAETKASAEPKSSDAHPATSGPEPYQAADPQDTPPDASKQDGGGKGTAEPQGKSEPQATSEPQAKPETATPAASDKGADAKPQASPNTSDNGKSDDAKSSAGTPDAGKSDAGKPSEASTAAPEPYSAPDPSDSK